jgi:UPF0716 protein FxsA
MRLPAWLLLSFAVWLAAEGVALALIVHLVGFAGAVLLTILTSFAGLAMLRKLGVAAAFRLRQSLAARAADRAPLSRETFIDGSLSTLGSVLLILPGFVSDFLGLALAAPSIRGWVAERIGTVGKRGGTGRHDAAPEVVELEPQEWSRLEEPAPRHAAPERERGRSARA